MVAEELDVLALGDLDAACFPGVIETVDVVLPNLISLEDNATAKGPNAELSVVMNVASEQAAARTHRYAGTAVPAGLGPLDGPVLAGTTIDGAVLGRARILLDDEISDQ